MLSKPREYKTETFKLKDPYEMNKDFKLDEALYKPKFSEHVRQAPPVIEPIRYLRDKGIIYENYIPAQLNYV